MEDLVEIVRLYVEDAGLIEEKLDEMSLDLKENIQNELYHGHGAITRNLRDGITSGFEVDGLNGVVRAQIGDSAPYGVYVDEGHTLRNGEWWEGYHFMQTGLDNTLQNYR